MLQIRIKYRQNRPNNAKSNNRPARNKYKYFKSNIRRRPNIFAHVLVWPRSRAAWQPLLRPPPFLKHNTQPALHALVSLLSKCKCCMLSTICTLGACNKKLQKTNTKYEYESNIAQNTFTNKYFQIKPNQILAVWPKYESNNAVFIQIRLLEIAAQTNFLYNKKNLRLRRLYGVY